MKSTHNKRIFFKKQICLFLTCFLFVAFGTWAQHQTGVKTVKGRIVNAVDKESLPGATVTVVGSTRGVATDIDGTFSIEVSSKDKLLFQFLGMQSKTIQIGNQTFIEVGLEPQASELEEVTVVGYGKQKKASVIGAISSVSPSELRTPVGNLSTSLAGQLAGAIAAQRTGEPGAQSDFWIRGVSTFGAYNRPLILVDGIERPLDLVDTEDIQTLSILKDATATAVYGVKGANGVILITTRRGKEARPVVSVRVENGFLSPTKMPEMASAEQFVELYNDVYRDQYGSDRYTEEEIKKFSDGSDPDLYPNINWMKQIFKEQTTNQRVTLNITGGTKQVRYYVAGSFYNENGIYNTEKVKQYNPSIQWSKYNFRANVDLELFKGNTVSLNIANQYDVKNEPFNAEHLWHYTFRTPAIAVPLKFSNGLLSTPGDGGINPYNYLNYYGDIRRFTNNMQSLINITQDFSDIITPGLQANIKFSWDAASISTNQRYKLPQTYHANGRDMDGELNLIKSQNVQDFITLTNWNTGERVTYLEGSLTYNRLFADKHRVGALMLFNRRELHNNFPSNLILSFPYRNIGLAGRVTYSFMDKYFAEWNFGYNGSENFAPSKRFGFFPSFALGYLISNEKFWEPLLPVVDILKLKGSYGLIGNDKLSGNRRFAYNSEMQVGGGYPFGVAGNNWIGGIGIGYQGNPNVSWETAYKTNVGIEIGLFNQLRLQVDYFKEDREDIFIERQSIPSIAGVAVKPWLNIGRMHNSGVDMSLEYNKKIGEVFLSARGNFTYNRNKVIDNDQIKPIYPYLSNLNKPLYQQYGLVALGFFESEEDIATSPRQTFGNVRVGDIKYKDINNDGKIDDNDRIPIGRTHIPEINYGFGGSVQWKGIDLSLFFQGVDNVTHIMSGSTIYGFSEANFSLGGIYADVAENRWRPFSTDAKYPRISLNENLNNNRASTLRQYDAGYLRLKNMEIGYTIPKRVLSSTFVDNCRIYLQGVNLLTFSNFKLWDPEILDGQGSKYPNMRVVNLGVNFKF